jgi:hypothetical protein
VLQERESGVKTEIEPKKKGAIVKKKEEDEDKKKKYRKGEGLKLSTYLASST